MAFYGYQMDSLEKVDRHWQIFLHKIDTLSPEKMCRRNLAFNELAKSLDVDYDGWDIEHILHSSKSTVAFYLISLAWIQKASQSHSPMPQITWGICDSSSLDAVKQLIRESLSRNVQS
ncbi:Regulator of ribonuclease activity B [Dyadobacter sp. SG02]|nr:Regulator of ribonuclease activity B [Dyadobacter sp. SG02]